MIKKIWNVMKDIGNFIKTVLEPISKAISSIINFVLLSLVYLVGIGTVSIFAKIFGKHFLDIKKQNRKSNWYEHKLEKQPLEKYYRTF